MALKNMGILIKEVYEGSIAEKLGIKPGDILLTVNGSDVRDMIEYRYMVCDTKLEIKIQKIDGDIAVLNIKKDFGDDIGIEIDDPIMKDTIRCSNKCMFCFIDQLPKGMRETLYVKDDDSRLSFLMGNFITLTNMCNEDIDRIIKYRISPINVSVHTTNPDLRIKVLKNKKAGNIMENLKKLTDAGIRLNCQIVSMPGINDGIELERTLIDLSKLYPGISNVAIVPVGLTKYREGLEELETYDAVSSDNMIKLVSRLQKSFKEELGETFARLSDEFYILSGTEVPEYEHYGDFEQLEDGIGMIRYFENAVEEELEFASPSLVKKDVAFITGEMPAEYIKKWAAAISEKLNINIKVYVIKNEFFGGKVSVTGLLTGKDILGQLKGVIKENIAFIPSSVFKADEDILLDDVTLDDMERELGITIIKVKYTGEDLIEKLTEEVILCQNL